jgi:hypothetical protein
MDAQRSEILSQLAAGTLSADQAAEQLRGEPRPMLAGPAPADRPFRVPTPEQKAALAGRWLHIRVTRLPGGEPKVAVNLPLNLVAVGLGLGARYSEQLAGLDLEDLLASVSGETLGPLVDVEDLDDGERVQIYID